MKVNGTKSSDTKLGLNIGMGGNYIITEQLTGFAETKYIVSNADQAVITVGILYKIK